ncbi:hypothetical protein BMW23_1148 [Bodo saltans virus]|uniref:Uncharacterized protein n=1 Tax=Bodo saltans virus TaxID=2024608 RepID=A0A2H4UW82_9VIRU|nr:hypothetical protein QJ851_gp1128 [Bodo saltans virus]ATZ81191.1 hypothetical protein BMW23_1148 [Bodo saltans virus]
MNTNTNNKETVKITKDQLIFRNDDTDDTGDLYTCRCLQSRECGYCTHYEKKIPVSKETYVNAENIEYKIPFGTVMYLCADRCPDDDLFVVLEHTDTYIKCIFPRMRYIDGNVVLGQDKLTDTKYTEKDDDKKKNYECKCTNAYLNVSTCDKCKNCDDMMNAETFMKVSDTYEYVTYNLKSLSHLVYACEISKNEINQIDSRKLNYVRMQLENEKKEKQKEIF